MEQIALGRPPVIQNPTLWQKWVASSLAEIERASYIDATDFTETVRRVTSVDALRLLTRAAFAGTMIWLASYYDRSAYADGIIKGGGPLVFDAADTSTADNAATVFVDADGGRWKRDHQGEISLGQGGGKIDKTSDDLVAFNRLLALVNSNTSGVNVIRLEAGEFYTSTTPDAIYRVDGAIIGAGMGATNWKMPDTEGTFLRVGHLNGSTLTKATRWRFSGFQCFYVTSSASSTPVDTSNTTDASIDVRAASFCRFADIIVRSAVHGLRIGYDNADGEVNQCIFSGLQFPDCGVSFDGGTGLDILCSTGCQYENNYFAGYGRGIADSRPFRMKPALAALGIDGNTFIGNIWNYNDSDNDYNFEFDATYPAIQNARFALNTMDGGALSSIYFTIGAGATSRNCTIHNLTFAANRITAATGHPTGGGSAVIAECDANQPIHRITFTGNNFGIGLTKPFVQQSRGGGVLSRHGGMTFAGNDIGINLGILCEAATTGNVTLSGLQTIDGYVGGDEDVILVRAQTNPAENGPYRMKSGAWIRSGSFNEWDKEIVGALIVIANGSTYAGTVFQNTNVAGGTLDTTAITFTTTTVDHNFLEIDLNNFTFTGNTVSFWSAQSAAVDNPFFPYLDHLVEMKTTNTRKVIITGNNFPLGFADYALADVRNLTASLLDEGPIIKDNSGINDSARRMLLTSNTTVTTIGTMAIPDDSLVVARGYVVGIRSATAEFCRFSFDASVSAAAGTATIKSGGTPTLDFEDAAGTDVTLTVSGDDFNIRVQGTANTYRWHLYIDHLSISRYLS